MLSGIKDTATRNDNNTIYQDESEIDFGTIAPPHEESEFPKLEYDDTESIEFDNISKISEITRSEAKRDIKPYRSEQFNRI